MLFPRIRRATQLVTTLLVSSAVTLPIHAQRSSMTAGVRSPVTRAMLVGRDTTDTRAAMRPRSMSDDLLQVYGNGEWTLLWSQDGIPTASAQAMIDAISRLDERGIPAADFGGEALQALATSSLASAEQQVEFDTTMTIASIRVLRALRGGATSGAQMAPRRTPLPASDDIFHELRTLASTATPGVVLDAAEPAYPQYRMLKSALPRYRALAASDSAARTQVQQIELTLERWRWLPRDTSSSAIIVNIPEFRLYAWRTDSAGVRDTLTMDVVVGDATAYRTPIFSDSIQYLEFAPFWNVPKSLVQTELLPIARRDPYLLTMNNYQIVNSRSAVLPATPASVRLVEQGKAWIRQLPGGTNALGKVKFMFPNEFDVYLHDTPVRRDFLATRRDASHGCIRVADPAALARLLLRDQPQWTADAVANAMGARTTQRVTLTRPVPVHLIYATAVAAADGTVTFHEDIYGMNAPLAATLAAVAPN